MDPQLKAIETIDCNLAVNAGAGTGKTKVLIERFVYILENGDLEEFKEVESIVAITFTNKATEEMIERIRKEIKKNFHKGNRWKRYYQDLDKANISTIHGFCSKILRENPVEANIDPYFEILDENRSNSLLNKSIVQVLENGIEEEHNIFKMMEIFRESKFDTIIDTIINIYNSIRTVAMSFEEVRNRSIEYINSHELKLEDVEEVKDIVLYLMDNLAKNSKIVKFKSTEEWIEFYNDDYESQDLFKYIECIQDNLGNSKKEAEKIDRLKHLLSKILINKEKEYIWLYETILDLLIKIDKVYERFKKEEGGLDYNDLQNKVLYLLDNDDIRKRYQDKFKYFMIDEFQDTNELQKSIFYKLASNKTDLDRENLFIVGDPKQSIYGFRGADIDVFYETVEDIASYNPDSVINLETNYRSLDTLIKFTNSIFSDLMGEKYIALGPFKESENKIDVEIIDEEVKKVEGVAAGTVANIEEAEIIAKRIKSLVGEGIYNYGDIALLFRGSKRIHKYEDVLKDFGIPYFNFSSKGFFKKEEIIDLINGIKMISNPYDHIAAIGFLRGPMIGLRDDTIYWILRNKEENIYKTLLKINDMDIILKEEKSKIDKAIGIMKHLFHIKDLYNISYIVEELVDITLFTETLLLKSHGDQAIANVYKFIEMTKEYDNENKFSLEDFIDYIEEARDGDKEEGLIYSEDDNVVNIMTIHGSKGLQFPVVIIPEMSRNSGGRLPDILFDKDVGIGIKIEDNQTIHHILGEDIKRREKEETNRVLYVAMTRAEELLILGNQGGNRGFKKLIKDLLPEEQYRNTFQISVDKSPVSSVKELGLDKNIKDIDKKNKDLPLLYKLDEYDKKTFTRYNISQYMEFKDCKRKFFLNNYWKLNIDLDGKVDDQEFKLSGIDKGNIIHEFCYLYREGMDKDLLLKGITKSYCTEYKDIRNEVISHINNYIKDYTEDYDEIYREKQFYTKIGEGYLTGIIDRINIKGDSIEVLDYKTNRLLNKEELIKRYTPQIQIYAYVVERIFNKPVKEASVIFLENGEKVPIDISSNELKNTKKEIENFIHYINNNSDLDNYERSSKCGKYCPHRYFCERI